MDSGGEHQALASEIVSTTCIETVSFSLWFLLTDHIVDNSPSPGSYRLQSEFDPESSMNKSKAFSFGISREAYEKVYIPSQKTSVQKDIPGPG